MKNNKLNKGFTLLELIIIIVIIGAIAVVAAPRFLSIADDAREATGRALFDNFRSGAEIYQGACLARGGDVTELQGKNTSDFNIDGVYSNFSGSCYPVKDQNENSTRRDIRNAKGCYALFQEMVSSDHFVDIEFNGNGWTNNESFNAAALQTALNNDFQIYIHQRREYFSYCHYYNIEGDLTNAPFLLYNAVDGTMITGTQDISNGVTWQNELQRYPTATPPPYNK